MTRKHWQLTMSLVTVLTLLTLATSACLPSRGGEEPTQAQETPAAEVTPTSALLVAHSKSPMHTLSTLCLMTASSELQGSPYIYTIFDYLLSILFHSAQSQSLHHQSTP